MKRVWSFILAMLILNNICLLAQAPYANDFIDLERSAEAAKGKKDWKAAVALFTQIVNRNPVDGSPLYNLASAYYEASMYDSAIDGYNKAMALGAFSPADCLFQLAKCYAKKGKREEAYQDLKKSFDAGFRSYQRALQEPAFNAYQQDPAFRRILGLAPSPVKDRIEGWRFDLSLIQREIKRKAVKPYRFDEGRLDILIKETGIAIPRLTDFQIAVSFMKILAFVNDGHTMLYTFSEKIREFQQNLPLEFSFFNDGLFITAADRRFENIIGARVTAIDGKKIEKVIGLLIPVITKDNKVGLEIMSTFFLRLVPLLHELGISASSNKISLEVTHLSGKKEFITVPADSPIPSRRLWDALPEGWLNYFQHAGIAPPLSQQQVHKAFWFDYLPESKTVYFQHNRVAPENPDKETFVEFTTKLFAFIESNEVNKLVIDLRINDGGNTRLLVNFMQALMGCRKICQRGKLFVLIGKRTYSAAQNFTTFLEKWTPATLVGEPTGSSPNFVGEELEFELPYSGLWANISDWFHQSSWPDDYRTWVAPEIYIPAKFDDYKRGYDRALDEVLKYQQQDKF